MNTAVRARLGPQRWHFQQGPIDLIIGIEGDPDACDRALDAAWKRFESILPELVLELPQLRAPVGSECRLHGPVARRMWQACVPFTPAFITPMAAVAGSVAQEIVGCLAQSGVRRAWVNNGGDIALHLSPGESATLGVCVDPRRPVPAGQSLRIDADSAIRGVATSGWRGRSFSLGIADAVTVLGVQAGMADAAATMIANQVNCDDAVVSRRPACELKDDTDLGELPVTVAVGRLSIEQIEQALAAGARFAGGLLARGLIVQAMLSLQGRSRIVA